MATYKGKNMKLGGGGRFAKGSADIQKKEGFSKERADAIMAAAGRKKYGSSKMAAMSAHGRKDHTSGSYDHPSTSSGLAQHAQKASAADHHGQHMHSVLQSIAGHHAGDHGA